MAESRRVALTFGLVDADPMSVAKVLAEHAGQAAAPRTSDYIGGYFRLMIPERVDVKPNLIDTPQVREWRYEERRDLAVIVQVPETTRPEYFEQLIDGLPYPSELLRRHELG